MFKIKAEITQLARSSLLMVIGNMAATSISAVAMIIISRQVGPAGFGEFSVGFALLLVILRFLDVGTNTLLTAQLPQQKTLAKSLELQRFSLMLRLIAAAFVAILGFAISGWVANWFHIALSTVWLVISLVFATSAYEWLQAILQVRHAFELSVLANAVQALAKLIVTAALMLAGITHVFPYFLFYIVAPLVAVLLFLLFDLQHMRNQLGLLSMLKFRQLFVQFRQFNLHAMVGLLATALIENIDILLVSSMLSAHDTGILAGVGKIAMFVLLVGYSLANVFNPRVAAMNTRSELRTVMRQGMFFGLVVGVCALVIMPLLPFCISLILGSAYVEGAQVLQLQVAAAAVMIATVPFAALFYRVAAPKYFSFTGVIQLVLMVVGHIWFLPMFGLIASGWVRLASRGVILIVTMGWGYDRVKNAKLDALLSK